MELPFEKSRNNGNDGNDGYGENLKFPRIPEGFEPKWNNSNIPGPGKPDFTPDFSERFDIENDSICLALHTLGLSRSEYNSMSVDELKSQRRIDCGIAEIYAWNILAHYKKNSKLFLPELSPTRHNVSNNFLTLNTSLNHSSPKIFNSGFDLGLDV